MPKSVKDKLKIKDFLTKASKLLENNIGVEDESDDEFLKQS